MKPIERVSEYHEKAIQGLRDMIRGYAQQVSEDIYPFEVTIMAMDRYAECDMPTPISVDNIIVDDNDIIVCYDDGEGEDRIELFSYDETYEILCELCKRL